MLKTGFVNIYKSGFYHRSGKPGTYERHPGDIYERYEDAVKDIFPPDLYVATVQIAWEDHEDVQLNPLESTPVPLAQTRRERKEILFSSELLE